MPPLGQSAQALPFPSGRLFRGSPLAARPPKERAVSIPLLPSAYMSRAGPERQHFSAKFLSLTGNRAGRALRGAGRPGQLAVLRLAGDISWPKIHGAKMTCRPSGSANATESLAVQYLYGVTGARPASVSRCTATSRAPSPGR
jgi:hypothetical protein